MERRSVSLKLSADPETVILGIDEPACTSQEGGSVGRQAGCYRRGSATRSSRVEDDDPVLISVLGHTFLSCNCFL